MHKRISVIFITVLAAGLVTLAGRSADAWWTNSHGIITQAAASKLPDDAPAFLRAAGVELAEMVAEPDDWKSPTTPALRAVEHPEHFIDLEYLNGAPIPKTRAEIIKLYTANGVEPYKAGFLPYALQEGYERLMLAFRQYRNKPDSKSVQSRIIVYAGWLAHYCQDAAMPLHTTKIFDGKPGEGKELKQKGIHARIDAYPEKNKFTPEQVAEGLKADEIGDTWPAILKFIQESHTHVEKCYELDLEGAFDAAPEKGRELMLERTRAGAKLTLDLWYSAWKNSAPEKATIPQQK